MSIQVKVLRTEEAQREKREAGSFTGKDGKEVTYDEIPAYTAQELYVQTCDLNETRATIHTPYGMKQVFKVGDTLLIEAPQLEKLNKIFDMKSLIKYQPAK